ncbi:alpha/beta-hydrolase [Athelia psychrophila]|uniref:Alpha/beta-hydrolase n=1 Tax=Athelia psychrophila TaxID=1759441 RepID=A0A166C6W3_9AGAM|nr:alpha/beta-hydrolase [Fibularhizoctonia sp. CBS 109695]
MAGYAREPKYVQLEEPLGITTRAQLPRHRGWKLLASAALIVGSVLYTQSNWKVALRTNEVEAMDEGSDWYTLRPSANIDWTSCFDGFKCARLILPLDYLTPNGPQIQVALQMLPATDIDNYKGTILVNPGGPGGSSTEFVQEDGRKLSKIVGPEFDILGFDPRGVGATTPRASCFKSESQEKAWMLQEGGLLNASDNSIPLARSRKRVVSELCRSTIGGNGQEDINGTTVQWGIGRFVGTASVATDMLRITEKLGQEKLQYWGFSYGSILGQYFSAMYPDRVGRVVIDGVYDANDYRAMRWATNLESTEDVLASFFDFCHEAGPEKCPLYAPSVPQIRQRVEAIMNSLDLDPIPIPFSPKGPNLLTRKVAHTLMFEATYTPIKHFPRLADLFLAAEQRNTSVLAQIPEVSEPNLECNCQVPPPWSVDSLTNDHAIGCGDGIVPPGGSRNFTEHLSDLTKKSPFAAPIWASINLQCAEWNVSAKWRYAEPFAAANTSHPILLVSPSFDPVTPLTDAMAVRERYIGAGLLVQDSHGHCSIAAPSICTAKNVRAYFYEGKLPEEGTICNVDELPFVGEVGVGRILDTGDRELLDALKGLATAKLPTFGFGF